MKTKEFSNEDIAERLGVKADGDPWPDTHWTAPSGAMFFTLPDFKNELNVIFVKLKLFKKSREIAKQLSDNFSLFT